MASTESPKSTSLDDSLDSDSEGRELSLDRDDSHSDFEENDQLLPHFGLSSPKKTKTSSCSSTENSPPMAMAQGGVYSTSPQAVTIPRNLQNPNPGHAGLTELSRPERAGAVRESRAPVSRQSVIVEQQPLAACQVHKSPARRDDPMNLSCDTSPFKSSTDQYQKSEQETKKLFSKGRKLSKALKEKGDKKEKLLKIATGGGIRGMAKKWEEEEERASRGTSEEGDAYYTTQTPSVELFDPGMINYKGANINSPPLPVKPPGRPIFVNAPSFVTELYPPGVELPEGGPFARLESTLIQDNPQALREIVCGKWLSLCYQHKPCPHTVCQWLFQLMCLADEDELSSGAFRSLLSLLKLSTFTGKQASFHVPSLEEIVGVLVSLGAERARLLPGRGSTDALQETDGSDDVFDGLQPPLRRLSRLIDYLSALVKASPQCYSTGELVDLVMILLSVSLDPAVCGQLIEANTRHCISALVAALPEDGLMEAVTRLTEQAVRISQHHHSCLHVATMITGVSPKQRLLQESICRASILQELGLSEEDEEAGEKMGGETRLESKAGTEAKIVSGSSGNQFARKRSFLRRVIQYYCNQKQEDIDYYSMHSVLLLLSLLIHPAEMQWSSNAQRKEFEMMLGQLVSTRLRDNTSQPERGPVKDLLIRMKLEINSQRVQGPKQTTLSSMFGSE